LKRNKKCWKKSFTWNEKRWFIKIMRTLMARFNFNLLKWNKFIFYFCTMILFIILKRLLSLKLRWFNKNFICQSMNQTFHIKFKNSFGIETTLISLCLFCHHQWPKFFIWSKHCKKCLNLKFLAKHKTKQSVMICFFDDDDGFI
jgi:hypothetical protein